MSEINVINAAKPKPIIWRQFGTSFEGQNLSVREAVKAVGADYTVSKEPLVRIPQDVYKQILHGEPVDNLVLGPQNLIHTHMATVKNAGQEDNQTFGVVGSDYACIQNEKAFEFADFIEEVSGHKPIVETAGLLGNGSTFFVTTKMNNDVFLDKNDPVSIYAVFCTDHTGRMGASCLMSSLRIICSNSLRLSLRGAKVTFRHTKNVDRRMDWELEENRKRALQVFSQSVAFSKEFEDRMLRLKAKTVTDEDVKSFVGRLYLSDENYELLKQHDFNIDSVEDIPTAAKNKVNLVLESVDNAVGQRADDCAYRGTALWLLNGLTSFQHNVRTWKSPEYEFQSIIQEGTEAKRAEKAFELLIAA